MLASPSTNTTDPGSSSTPPAPTGGGHVIAMIIATPAKPARACPRSTGRAQGRTIAVVLWRAVVLE